MAALCKGNRRGNTTTGIRGSRVLLILVCCLFAVLMVPTGAAAQKRVLQQPRGDAKAPWDITKITVVNGKRKLYVRLDYRGSLRIKPITGFLVNVSLDLGSPATSEYDADYTISLLRGSTDPKAPNRFQLNRDFEPVSCRGKRARVRPQQGIVAFWIPQRCFGAKAGRVRITGYTYRPRGEPSEADYLDGWSRWIKRGKARRRSSWKRCGSISFRANTEFGASGIKARKVGCKAARAVARKSKNYGAKGEPGRRVSYRDRKFTCRGVEVDEALPVMHFHCKRGRAAIRFRRT